MQVKAYKQEGAPVVLVQIASCYCECGADATKFAVARFWRGHNEVWGVYSVCDAHQVVRPCKFREGGRPSGCGNCGLCKEIKALFKAATAPVKVEKQPDGAPGPMEIK